MSPPSILLPLCLQDLIQELRSGTSGNFRECIVALMEPKVPLCFNSLSFFFHLLLAFSSSLLLLLPSLPLPLPSLLLLPLPPLSPSSLLFLYTDFSSLSYRLSMMPKLCTVLSVKQEQMYSASLKSCAPVPTRRLQRSGRPTRIVSLAYTSHCTIYNTSKMIYHGTQPRKTAGFVTVCCSMSMVSKTLCSHFSSQGSYYSYTHAWTKFHNEVMS